MVEALDDMKIKDPPTLPDAATYKTQLLAESSSR